ncbi:MAG: hypothetical protein KGJ77_10465 [Acidobacteriota bacterium]|nr:hypothetical protein [Acidobacteriota bacterium]
MVDGTQDRPTGPRRFGLFAVAAVMGAALAACSAAGTATARPPSGPVVSAVENAAFGTILSSGGKTVYTLVPSSTACDSACTRIWPELVLPSGVTTATAGSGVRASDLGTVDRGGVRQVTYAGKPLYFFAEDTAAGQAKGNITDVWGKWSVVPAAGPAGNVEQAPTTAAPVPTTVPTTTTTAPGVGGGAGF